LKPFDFSSCFLTSAYEGPAVCGRFDDLSFL
jgi:hypothetical protein